jgi:hypothetical protein
MLIVTTVKKTTEEKISKEVELPYYFSFDNDLYAVVAEDKQIRVSMLAGVPGFKSVSLVPHINKDALAQGEQITEEEFDRAFAAAIHHMTQIAMRLKLSTAKQVA